MRRALRILMLLGMAWLVPAVAVHAQRGVGQGSGIAAGVEVPAIVSFTGRVVEVKTEPCQATTGRASVGTHFLLKKSDGEVLNIHLGPASEVAEIAEELTANRKITATCFRTAKMAAGDYVAKSVTVGDRTLELRDQGLRPTWAGVVSAKAGQSSDGVTSSWRRRGGRGSRRGWGSAAGYGQGRSGGRNLDFGDRRGRAFIDANGDDICDRYPR